MINSATYTLPVISDWVGHLNGSFAQVTLRNSGVPTTTIGTGDQERKRHGQQVRICEDMFLYFSNLIFFPLYVCSITIKNLEVETKVYRKK